MTHPDSPGRDRHLMQAVRTRSAIFVDLPCLHHRARVHGRDQAIRRCSTCGKYWMIEFFTRELATVTDITCAACGGELDSLGDQWICKNCGDEWDDRTIRGGNHDEHV